jgi:4-alpha-glucanotransferase
MTSVLNQRTAGVLLHPTSLPGPAFSGDLGPAAHRFVAWLRAARQRVWQMLPVGPPGFGASPYQAFSSFAGNPLLVSLEGLRREGLLDAADLGAPRDRRPHRADFPRAARFRLPRLLKAHDRFRRRPGARAALEKLRAEQAWLADWALFAALKDAHDGAPWAAWEPGLRDRRPAAIAAARRELAEVIAFHEFVQLEFDRQWAELRARCRAAGVALIGDLPCFAAHDSADVWAARELFHLDRRGRPTVVAGVPPDYFSATGQLWGNPLYRWPALAARGYDYVVARLRALLRRFDAVRLDHFIGFHRYWAVPAGARTAAAGRYRAGPGAALLRRLRVALGELPLIAEDLGVVTPEVKALRDRFGLPGMRVLQFAFGDDPEADNYKPHNYPRDCVVYTGTHDNDTTVGWFRDRAPGRSTRARAAIAAERAAVLRYLGSDGHEIHWDMVRLALMSSADLAVVPAQDLLGLGSAARMNRPGSATGNWRWRACPDAFSRVLAARLAALTAASGRHAQLPTPRYTSK